MMPREKTAQFSSAPPLKRLKRAAMLPPCFSVSEVRNHSWITAWLTPGVVIAAPNRTMTMIASVNRMRRRSSGILTVFKNAETIAYDLPVNRKALALPRFFLFRRGFRGRFFRRGGLLRRFRLGRCFRLLRRVTGRGLLGIAGALHGFLPQRDTAPSLLDFFPRRRANLVRLDRDRVFQFAVAQNLQPVPVSSDHLLLPKKLFVDNRAFLERRQVVEIHDRVILVERGAVKSALRQTPDERHLAAFESEPDAAARARLLALVTLAAGLAVAGAFAATEAFHPVLRAGPRPHVIKPDHD